ncbi:hypothetical protein LC653_03255 [Nostoc sp. CHAB 5784]|nr:hypothetical protein [Nostoc mirabile]MCC5662979.1 hypothetical protein [Nostoc mirabile CHAB5784]
MNQLATQVAIAIQQSELYKQLQTLNAELEHHVQQQTQEFVFNVSRRIGIVSRCIGIVSRCIGIVSRCIGIVSRRVGIVNGRVGIVNGRIGIVSRRIGIGGYCQI